MFALLRLASPALSFLILCGCATSASQEPPQRPGDPLVARLKEGGYVLYFRHGRTDASNQDRQDKPEWWKSCDPKRHRLLSDEGRAQMETVGSNMRALKIPVAKVFTSEYCRAVDSALLLQLMPITQSAVLNYADAQRYVKRNDAQIIAELRTLFSEKPLEGKNTILVGHVLGVNPPIDPVFSQLVEAEAIVMKPLGEGKFDIVGRVTVDKWAKREQ